MENLTTTLYRCFDKNGSLLYVGITSRGPARHHEHQKFSDWWFYSASITLEHYENREDALAEETKVIKTEYPYFNKSQNILRPRIQEAKPKPVKEPTKLALCKFEIKDLYFENPRPCPANYALMRVSARVNVSTKTVQRAADAVGIIRVPVRWEENGAIKSWNWHKPETWKE